jgi:class 3 adenylate cyclase
LAQIKSNNKNELKKLRESLKESKLIQDELDRRNFHLKTLYDVSQDILGRVDSETIVKNFLLMTMGNFGIIQGLIMILDAPSGKIMHYISKGFHDSGQDYMQNCALQLLKKEDLESLMKNGVIHKAPCFLPSNVTHALSFAVNSKCLGLLALGSKLTGEPYNKGDKELLSTLVNNLVVALKNAKSFEDIKHLNQDLQEKNIQIKKALNELQAAMRKVEILESIKASLCTFVPNTVTRLIEKSPTASLPDSREQDVSVLFIDIQGYSALSERLDSAKLHKIIEEYFSMFMDAIYANNGDVNETAGDGLMVLFLDEDERINALESVRTALTIREKVPHISQKHNTLCDPLVINMGINSGSAFLGVAKFKSLTGCRCTYTARGVVTNLAARIGDVASEGAIFLSRSTADRVKDHFSLTPMGKFCLKNVSEEVEIFSVEREYDCASQR